MPEDPDYGGPDQRFFLLHGTNEQDNPSQVRGGGDRCTDGVFRVTMVIFRAEVFSVLFLKLRGCAPERTEHQQGFYLYRLV